MASSNEDMRRVVESALGSIRAEGLEPSPEILAAADDLVAGRISTAKFVALTLRLVSDRRNENLDD